MAKAEELMALMVEEINRYEQLVRKMENLQQQKLEIDVSGMENYLKKHEAQLEHHRKTLDLFTQKMKKLMEDANIYPKWAVIVFIVSLILNCGLLFYLFI